MSDPVYSVSQVNQYISGMFSKDYLLCRLSVKGEVSNCTYHRSGHIYFTLKDESSAVGCVMFAGDRRKGLGFAMKNGDRVVVTGQIGVYVRDGRYQLYARQIEQQGAGLLYEKFLKLKAELEEMGMFAPDYKQPIPTYVRKLGIVTAPTGAAVQDIRNISLRRNPFIQLILYPALVQGEGAADSIVKGIRMLDAMHLDVIIVGRGGGSIEDLWAFNEEKVARAIFDCATPIISAVGHETDTTIADYVADLRAPTPSAAAELAVADVRALMQRLKVYEERLSGSMRKNILFFRKQTEMRAERIRYFGPENQIREKRQRLMHTEERIHAALEARIRENKLRLSHRMNALNAQKNMRLRQAEEYRRRLAETETRITILQKENVEKTRERLQQLRKNMNSGAAQMLREKRHLLAMLIQKMEGLSPLKKLNQGYSLAEDKLGKRISSVTQVQKGMELHVHVRDGCIRGIVTGTEKREQMAEREE